MESRAYSLTDKEGNIFYLLPEDVPFSCYKRIDIALTCLWQNAIALFESLGISDLSLPLESEEVCSQINSFLVKSIDSVKRQISVVRELKLTESTTYRIFLFDPQFQMSALRWLLSVDPEPAEEIEPEEKGKKAACTSGDPLIDIEVYLRLNLKESFDPSLCDRYSYGQLTQIVKLVSAINKQMIDDMDKSKSSSDDAKKQEELQQLTEAIEEAATPDPSPDSSHIDFLKQSGIPLPGNWAERDEEEG